MIELSIPEFTRAAKIAASVVEKRSTIPALTAIKARANGKFELIATDMDMTATVTIPGKAIVASEFLITDPKSVISALGAAGGATVRLEPFKDLEAAKSQRHGYKATAGKLVRSVQHGIHPEDFPSLRAHIATELFEATITRETMEKIKRIVPAISSEEIRYYLNGIHVRHLSGWTYRFEATDGHRLMVADIELPDAPEDYKLDVTIPRKFVHLMLANFASADGPLKLKMGLGSVPNDVKTTDERPARLSRFSLEGQVGAANLHMATVTIDGTYPAVDRVIPTDKSKSASFDVAEFRRAILAVSGNTKKDAGPALSLSFDKEGATIGFAFHVEGVTAEYKISAAHNMPEDFRIGFRPSYVLDMLNAIKSERVTFYLSDPVNPTLIRDTDDASFLGVLMPMRI